MTAAIVAVLVLAGLMLWRAVGSDETPSEAGPSPDSVIARLDVTVTLTDGITDAERAAIEEALKAIPAAGTVHYVTREQAWERFAALFSGSPDLLANVKPGVLPAELHVGLGELTDCGVLVPVRGLPGVRTVTVRLSDPQPTPTPSPALAAPAC